MNFKILSKKNIEHFFFKFDFVVSLNGAAVLAAVLLLIIKLLGGFEDTSTEEFGPTETNPLRPGKAEFVANNYGTISCEGIEKGNCSSSSSSENNISTNSSEDLYDGKLCVICYDEQRDCFFVPCGHCATCYVCAQRYVI